VSSDHLLLILVVAVLAVLRAIFHLYVENGRLISFARTLDRRRIEQGVFRLVRRVDGARDGRAVAVDVTRSGRLELRVAVPAHVGPLTIRRRALDAWLLSGLRRNVRFFGRFQLAGPNVPAERLADALDRVRALEPRLRACFDVAAELGATELRIEGGWLVAPMRQVKIVEAQTLLDCMVRLADALDGLALLNGRVRELEAASQRCPFCHDGVDGETTTCGACGSVQHAACWGENGGCSIFGCAASGKGEREPVRAADGPPPPPA